MTTSIDSKTVRPKPTIELVTEALNQAAQDAVEVHRHANQPLAVWKDGKVALIPPQSVETQTMTTDAR